MCPEKIESTMFALIAGCHHLGHACSEVFGAYLLHLLNVTPTGGPGDESKDFEYLWVASIVAAALPAATCIFIPFFIPDAKQTDGSWWDKTKGESHGCLWNRWFAKHPDDDLEQARLSSGVNDGSFGSTDRRGSNSTGSNDSSHIHINRLHAGRTPNVSDFTSTHRSSIDSQTSWHRRSDSASSPTARHSTNSVTIVHFMDGEDESRSNLGSAFNVQRTGSDKRI